MESGGDQTVALLDLSGGNRDEENQEVVGLAKLSWIESKKLCQIVGLAIFSGVSLYSINVITQAFVGHLGDIELASISFVCHLGDLELASISIVARKFGDRSTSRRRSSITLRSLHFFFATARSSSVVRRLSSAVCQSTAHQSVARQLQQPPTSFLLVLQSHCLIGNPL
ncbi:hypothetical protein ZIOFF_073224 [Zingiber officinale]|uniref:Uncharacterized protein n=1 Tax=Zingiber officinale TaxID=94328 RepID=A0A8J5BZT8_ZINOF|nr:hypothetical protein ZIOFF_073224 [Zingiber officinale]